MTARNLSAVSRCRKRNFSESHEPDATLALTGHGARFIAGRIQCLRHIHTLSISGDVDPSMIQVDLDLGAWVEALDRLCDRIDAALAGHAFDLHQEILAGFFHGFRPLRRYAGNMGGQRAAAQKCPLREGEACRAIRPDSLSVKALIRHLRRARGAGAPMVTNKKITPVLKDRKAALLAFPPAFLTAAASAYVPMEAGLVMPVFALLITMVVCGLFVLWRQAEANRHPGSVRSSGPGQGRSPAMPLVPRPARTGVEG